MRLETAPSVNLRKELVCSRAIHCASPKDKLHSKKLFPILQIIPRRNELRDYERRYSRPLRYLRC